MIPLILLLIIVIDIVAYVGYFVFYKNWTRKLVYVTGKDVDGKYILRTVQTNKHLLPSISHTVYYHWKPWLFALFMLGVGLPLILLGLYLQDHYVIMDRAVYWTIFGESFNVSGVFLIFAGILFTWCGLSPYFHQYTTERTFNGFESTWHSIGAEGGIGLVFAHLAFIEHGWPYVFLMIIPTAGMILGKTKNHTLWIELLGFVLGVFGMCEIVRQFV